MVLLSSAAFWAAPSALAANADLLMPLVGAVVKMQQRCCFVTAVRTRTRTLMHTGTPPTHTHTHTRAHKRTRARFLSLSRIHSSTCSYAHPPQGNKDAKIERLLDFLEKPKKLGDKDLAAAVSHGEAARKLQGSSRGAADGYIEGARKLHGSCWNPQRSCRAAAWELGAPRRSPKEKSWASRSWTTCGQGLCAVVEANTVVLLALRSLPGATFVARHGVGCRQPSTRGLPLPSCSNSTITPSKPQADKKKAAAARKRERETKKKDKAVAKAAKGSAKKAAGKRKKKGESEEEEEEDEEPEESEEEQEESEVRGVGRGAGARGGLLAGVAKGGRGSAWLEGIQPAGR